MPAATGNGSLRHLQAILQIDIEMRVKVKEKVVVCTFPLLFYMIYEIFGCYSGSVSLCVITRILTKTIFTKRF